MLGLSLGIFPVHSEFRSWVNYIIHTGLFQRTIDICIFINCITLASENPSNKDDSIFVYLDYVFTTIFVLEMVLKMIAKGVFEYPFFDEHTWKSVQFILM